MIRSARSTTGRSAMIVGNAGIYRSVGLQATKRPLARGDQHEITRARKRIAVSWLIEILRRRRLLLDRSQTSS